MLAPLGEAVSNTELFRSNPALAERYPLSLMSAKPHQFVNSCQAPAMINDMTRQGVVAAPFKTFIIDPTVPPT